MCFVVVTVVVVVVVVVAVILVVFVVVVVRFFETLSSCILYTPHHYTLQWLARMSWSRKVVGSI